MSQAVLLMNLRKLPPKKIPPSAKNAHVCIRLMRAMTLLAPTADAHCCISSAVRLLACLSPNSSACFLTVACMFCSTWPL